MVTVVGSMRFAGETNSSDVWPKWGDDASKLLTRCLGPASPFSCTSGAQTDTDA